MYLKMGCFFFIKLCQTIRKIVQTKHFEVKVGNKAFWYNFDVLNPKMLVINLDFAY